MVPNSGPPPAKFQVKGTPRRRTTSAERMADLRARNPGYDRIKKAEYRAWHAANRARQEAEKIAAIERMLTQPKVQLCLPAPVIDLTIEAINELRKKREHHAVAA